MNGSGREDNVVTPTGKQQIESAGLDDDVLQELSRKFRQALNAVLVRGLDFMYVPVPHENAQRAVGFRRAVHMSGDSRCRYDGLFVDETDELIDHQIGCSRIDQLVGEEIQVDEGPCLPMVIPFHSIAVINSVATFAVIVDCGGDGGDLIGQASLFLWPLLLAVTAPTSALTALALIFAVARNIAVAAAAFLV